MRPWLPATAWILRLLGLILLTAAVLKMHGLAVDPIRPTGWWATAQFQFGLVLGEILLGLGLISGYEPVGSWLTAVLVFATFAAFTFRQGWVGETSCGCLGQIRISPWIAFGMDMAVLAVLALAHPKRYEMVILGRLFAPVASCTLLVAVFSTLLMAYAVWAYGSVDSALAALRGEVISVQPGLIDLGKVPLGSLQMTKVTIINRTSEKVCVFGGTSDCSCTITGDLPVHIGTKEKKVIQVMVRIPRFPGQFTRLVHLLTNAPDARTVGFYLTGQGVEETSVADGR